MTRDRRPYAEGTKVEVAKSRFELEHLLTKAGASQIMAGADFGRRTGFVIFKLDGRQFKLTVPPPPVTKKKRDPEQVDRERWRALVLIVKAKLEIVASGMTTAEREFLADMMLPDGVTVGDELEPKLAEAYESGKQPKLMLPEWNE